jgi:flagellar hook-basal body complex protein FliE
MIDIFYLKSASEIRRKYLKINNNMSLYQNKTKDILDILNSSLNELNELQNSLKNDNNNKNLKKSIDKLLEVINNVEHEGFRLEKMLEPINLEIENLAKDEQELYRKIVEKYPSYSQEYIVNTVKEYIKAQGL